jgi:endonuclease III
LIEGWRITDQREEIILQLLEQNLVVPNWTVQQYKPFETLIATIISQNTSDTNTKRAFENLSKQFEVTPKILAEAETGELEDCLHVAGLYKRKAKSIKLVSEVIVERFGGSLESVLSLPHDEARKTLLELQGIGPKTADVVLLFSANKHTVPVDTHVNRVSKRLGFAPFNGDYETVRINLQKAFEPKKYLTLHLLLISLGRTYCKARKPLCNTCPINSYCPSRDLRIQK